MCEHQVLRSHPLCYGAKISSQALAIETCRRKSTGLVRPQDGVDRRVYDDVNSLRQSLHLFGCRGGAWRRELVVGSVAADHHTSSWRVLAIGRMARSMGRPDRTHFHVTGRPDSLGLVLRIERDHICQIRRPARETRLVLRAALGDLAGLEEGIADMRDTLSAAVRKPQSGCCIRTTNDVDLRPLQVPTEHHDVRKTFRVISMHMRKEDCIQ